jgi:hypothetical protein
VVEAVSEFHRVVVGDAEVAGFAIVAVVVAVRGYWVGGRVVRVDALASAPAGKGYQRCTEAQQVLLFLCLYVAF